MHKTPVPDKVFWMRLERLGLGTGLREQSTAANGPPVLLLHLVHAMRAERARCRQAHWTGDINRLAGLRASFRTLWPLRHSCHRW